MNFIMKLQNSVKFRTRYFLFSKLNFPSTAFSSLLFESFLSAINNRLEKKHRVGLSVGIKPITDVIDFRDPSFAIVFHGKIIDFGYLNNSLVNMRTSCPESHIVLSTYTSDITDEILNLCNVQRVEVVAIPEPNQLPIPYAVNLARAVCSAHSGLLRARELGATWAMKIRVDQDISRKSGLIFVKNLLEGKLLSGINSERIFGSSYNTYQDFPLFLSDMLHFGNIETLLAYWQPFDVDRVDELTKELFKMADDDLQGLKFVPEVWLATRFMLQMGVQITESNKSNDLFWREYAGVIDANTLGHNWAKTFDFFDSNYASVKWFEESFGKQYLELHFADWTLKVLDSHHEVIAKNLPEGSANT